MGDPSDFWFDGERTKEAIERARSLRKAILIFVEERGSLNKEFKDRLCGDKVKEVLNLHYVGLRFHRGTGVAQQFEQLVPISNYPSLFVFYDGKLLHEINRLKDDDEQLAARLAGHLEPNKESTSLSSYTSDLTLQEKKAMLLARLDEKKKEKEEERKAEEKLLEKSRRLQAKEFTSAKIALQERDLKNAAAELAKEKKEAREHQQRVREQIARDKAERMACKKPKEPIQLCSQPSSSNTLSDVTQCRLNLRVSSDGSSHRKEFEGDAPLSVVREYVAQKILPSGEAFDLIQTFPRRRFTASDELKSLRDLNLCPSNTLLIQIKSNSASTYALSDAGVTGTVSSWVNWGSSVLSSLVSSFSPQVAAPSTASTSIVGRNRITTLSETSNSTSSTSDPMSYNGNSTNQQ